MPRWLPRALTRIRRLAAAGRVHLTYKAHFEARDLGLAKDDVVELLTSLGPTDSGGRLLSAPAREWMYVFRPVIPGMQLYLKVVLRNDCIVVSCHDEQADTPEEAEHER